MAQQYKRRNYFINKPFQTRFILKFCLVVVLSSLVIGGLVYYVFQDTTTVAIENTQVVVKSTADFVLPIVINILFLVTVAVAIVVAFITMMTSHKIAGPLYRLQREIELLEKGDLRREFRIRNNDQLQELAVSLKIMCKSLQGKELEIRESFENLKDYYQQNKDNFPEEVSSKIKNYLSKLEEKINNFSV